MSDKPPTKCLRCALCDPGAVMVKSYKAEIKGLRRKVRRLEKKTSYGYLIAVNSSLHIQIEKLKKEVGVV